MKQAEIVKLLSQEIGRIAPDIDIADIEKDGDLREQFDIDSMDFLNLIGALSKQLKLPIPESDYPKMGSFNLLCQYLESETSAN